MNKNVILFLQSVAYSILGLAICFGLFAIFFILFSALDVLGLSQLNLNFQDFDVALSSFIPIILIFSLALIPLFFVFYYSSNVQWLAPFLLVLIWFITIVWIAKMEIPNWNHDFEFLLYCCPIALLAGYQYTTARFVRS